jgi:DNA-binding LacI/PurR family transcriptional regulator
MGGSGLPAAGLMGHEEKPRSAVMSDVAQLAGVSHQTVSRVLHDSPAVRPATRARVLEAMKELDYRPNSSARALVTGRTATLGVISFDTTLYGPASTVLGIERAAHDAGYFIIIVSLRSLTRASVRGALDRLRDRGVDGIVVIAPQDTAADALRDLPPGVPVVAAEAGPSDAIPVAEVDQLAGATLATRHLLDLGHRTVFHLAGPTDFLEAQERVAGWRATLTAAGIEPPPPLVGDWSARSGYELGQTLLDRPGVTAVFAANDPMALGLLRAIDERGLDTPGDISVVGFDGTPEAEFFIPPLTTVRQDFDEIGRRSLALLLERIERRDGRGVPERVIVDPELVVRQSTAAPRKEDR